MTTLCVSDLIEPGRNEWNWKKSGDKKDKS